MSKAKKELGVQPAEPRGAAGEGRDFIRQIVAEDLATGKHGGRVVTRFPPEPNGYPHIGHAKSICLNFGVAAEFGGVCHLRFDDTNPSTEDLEYVRAIQEDVRWLGFDWGENLFFASDYFERLYEFAEELIEKGLAYIDSSSEEEIRAYRGTVTEPGRESPYRGRGVAENLDLFRRMRSGEFTEGEHVLRARIDMAAANMKMRDPLLYRIREETHYRRGDDWSIYPMYDFAHGLSDAIEGVTHSLCTLEFENNREIYDWLLEHLDVPSHPQQIEFARLNVNYTITSKRKLLELVDSGLVDGWDDPRMPTLSGLRRRGYTPRSIRAFCDRIGVAKHNSTVDLGHLEHSIRDDLNPRARRVLCVLRPLKVVIETWPEGESETLDAPYFPHDVPGEGSRPLAFGREIFIEREDFREDPPKKFFRLAPGREVRLRHAYIVRCERVIKDPENGEVTELRCSHDPESLASGRRVKGTLHWVPAEDSERVEVRLYDRLFSVERPDLGEADFKSYLNPDSLEVLHDCRAEPGLAGAEPGSRFQFERHGYFYRDPAEQRPVFNRIVSLRDSWSKKSAPKPAAAAESPRPAAPRAEPSTTRKRKRRAAAERTADPEELARRVRFEGELGLGAQEAAVLAADPELAAFFEAAAARHDNPRSIASWIVHELPRERQERPLDELPAGPRELAELVALLDEGTISGTTAKELLPEIMREGGSPREMVEERGLALLDGAEELRPAVEGVLAEEADKVAEYRAGKRALLGFFVGRVMRSTSGRADARLARELLAELLDRE